MRTHTHTHTHTHTYIYIYIPHKKTNITDSMYITRTSTAPSPGQAYEQLPCGHIPMYITAPCT